MAQPYEYPPTLMMKKTTPKPRREDPNRYTKKGEPFNVVKDRVNIGSMHNRVVATWFHTLRPEITSKTSRPWNFNTRLTAPSKPPATPPRSPANMLNQRVVGVHGAGQAPPKWMGPVGPAGVPVNSSPYQPQYHQRGPTPPSSTSSEGDDPYQHIPSPRVSPLGSALGAMRAVVLSAVCKDPDLTK